MTSPAAILEELTTQLCDLVDRLTHSTDPTERLALLKQFRVLLAQADKLIADTIDDAIARYEAQSPEKFGTSKAGLV